MLQALPSVDPLSVADTRWLIRLAGDAHDLGLHSKSAWSLVATRLTELTGARCAAIGIRSGKPGTATEPWDVRGKHGFLSAREAAVVEQARANPEFVWEATERMLAVEDASAIRDRRELLPAGDPRTPVVYNELLDEIDWGDMLISKRPAHGDQIHWLCLMRPRDETRFAPRDRMLVSLAHQWLSQLRPRRSPLGGAPLA